MSLPTVTGVYRLVDDPELRFAASGTAVARIRLAANSRKKDQSGQWVDDKVCWLDATAFNQLAENVAESLSRGLEVVVTGRLVTEQWETKEGEKRSKNALLIDSIGPTLAYATAKVQKLERSSGGTGSRGRSTPADDPWATSAPSGGGGFNDDQPPF